MNTYHACVLVLPSQGKTFQFDKALGPKTTQQQMYEGVAKSIVKGNIKIVLPDVMKSAFYQVFMAPPVCSFDIFNCCI